MDTPSLDIRWLQRFANFKKAAYRLEMAVDITRQRTLSWLEAQGLIQAFEFTHELAWKVMKDFFTYQGTPNITGSRDATREAFKMELIYDGEYWMKMIEDRNQTTHTYDEAVAQEIVDRINNHYYKLFKFFEEKMESLKPHA